MKKLLIVAALALFATGCTDATMASLGSYGETSKITCFSGGEVVREYTSTGKVIAADQGDGVGFRSRETGKYVRVYADCVVEEI